MSCSVTDCQADVFIKKRQLCRPHYYEGWHRGDFGHTRRGQEWHRVDAQNLPLRRGLCSLCGPVMLVKSGGILVCQNASSEQARKSRHGLSAERIAEMLDAIGWACQICKADFRREVYCIGHDHACCPNGQSCGACARGILCRRCNAGIGMFLDQPELAEAAAQYLRDVRPNLLPLIKEDGDADLLPFK